MHTYKAVSGSGYIFVNIFFGHAHVSALRVRSEAIARLPFWPRVHRDNTAPHPHQHGSIQIQERYVMSAPATYEEAMMPAGVLA